MKNLRCVVLFSFIMILSSAVSAQGYMQEDSLSQDELFSVLHSLVTTDSTRTYLWKIPNDPDYRFSESAMRLEDDGGTRLYWAAADSADLGLRIIRMYVVHSDSTYSGLNLTVILREEVRYTYPTRTKKNGKVVRIKEDKEGNTFYKNLVRVPNINGFTEYGLWSCGTSYPMHQEEIVLTKDQSRLIEAFNVDAEKLYQDAPWENFSIWLKTKEGDKSHYSNALEVQWGQDNYLFKELSRSKCLRS